MKESLNVLFLSSRLPSHSAGFGEDLICSLRRAGHKVQFGFDGIEGYIEECTRTRKSSFFNKAYHKIHFYIRKYLNSISFLFPLRSSWAKDGLVFFHPYEDHPPLDENVIVNKLHGSFDICIVLFYHNMFTAKTYKAIYDKFKIPIIVYAVDMMPMTGGCYYFGDCRNFENECGFCPVCGGNNKNDQSHKNYLYKKNVYASIEYVLFANLWQLNFAKRSNLFEKAKMRQMSFTLDENLFAPRNVQKCRMSFDIPEEKKFIFISRYRTIARKGMDILINGINEIYSSLSEEKRKQSLIILIGEKSNDIRELFKMDVLQLGFLEKDRLIDAYNASTAFLCTSTEDAGPSMVNQAMACGTPVISFDAGCGVDMIDDGVNGFKVPVTEVDRWGEGLKRIYELNDEEYLEMRKQARIKAVNMNGLRSFSKAVEEEYMSFRPNGKK